MVVPTYFKAYESKKCLSSILKICARRLVRYSCKENSLQNVTAYIILQILSEMASKQDSALEVVRLLGEKQGDGGVLITDMAALDRLSGKL